MAVQHAFGTVLWIVCGVGIVIAFVALAMSGKTWSEFGKDRLLMDSHDGVGRPAASAAALLERDTEIRQLLEARNARRAGAAASRRSTSSPSSAGSPRPRSTSLCARRSVIS